MLNDPLSLLDLTSRPRISLGWRRTSRGVGRFRSVGTLVKAATDQWKVAVLLRISARLLLILFALASSSWEPFLPPSARRGRTRLQTQASNDPSPKKRRPGVYQ
jgi:hypothetical protein